MLLIRSYSHHSLLSAVPQIADLVSDAKSKGYTAIALTDEDTGSGFIEFYEECKRQEIQAVLGATLRIPNATKQLSQFGSNKDFSKVAILAKNEAGYKNLLELISLARTKNETPANHIKFKDINKLKNFQDNLILVLSSDGHEFYSAIQNQSQDLARQILQKYLTNLPNLTIVLELVNSSNFLQGEDLNRVNKQVQLLAAEFRLQIIISPGPRYLQPEDEETFKVVLAIRNQVRLSDIDLQRDFWLPKVEDLKQVWKDFPEALKTGWLTDQIDIKIRTDYDSNASEAFFPPVDLEPGQNHNDALAYETYLGLLSKFSPLQKSKDQWKKEYKYQDLEKLKQVCLEMQVDPKALLGYPESYWQEKGMPDYVKQIDYELQIIKDKGYSSYFLVLADIASFCRENNIIASARGSGAGSLVGYLNNISTPDTIYYNIPFERFLNPLRPSAPDIDLDISDDRREDVINYLTKKYGSDRVCQIITFGTMLPRAGVRDVGRVLGISYRKCDRISKIIPVRPLGKKTTFDWAFETSSEFTEIYQKDADCKRIIDIAKKIEGNYRHASVHAAGLYITPTKLTDYTPLQWDSDHKMIISQYDWHIGEMVGLVKMDLLGIRNLSILGNSIALSNSRNEDSINVFNINLADSRTFEILSQGRTMGTFQLSSDGMTKHLKDLKPSKVQDLMAMVALYRPGAMASIPEYIKRRNDAKLVKFYVPEMKEWMEQSYGIFVYQEDVILTAVKLAGYSFGEADNFRRALGKKKIEVMNKEKERFFEGCLKNGLKQEKVQELWDLIIPFSDYGFNKAHSAAYGLVAYWTAYMKANYSAEFMTAYMTAEGSNLDRIALAITESRELGLEVLPPDVNSSFESFTIEGKSVIRYGLGSVKNLGSDVIKYIIEDREKNGKFSSLQDFLSRLSLRQGFNKRSLEALICGGCLDSLGSALVQEMAENSRIKIN